jgi:hypothetical protein
MLTFLRSLVVCTAVGILLAVVFLSPTGAVVGAVNGLLVGFCVGLAEWRAQRAQMAVVPVRPIRLIGSYLA